MIDPLLLKKIKKKQKKAKRIVKPLKKVRMLYATRSITPRNLVSDELLHPAFIQGNVEIERLVRRKNGLVVKRYPFGYMLVELFVPEAMDVLEHTKRSYDAERTVNIPKPVRSKKGTDDLWHVRRVKTLRGRCIPPSLDGKPWTGLDVRVAVIDTGVGPHPFVDGNVRIRIDMTGEGVRDYNGHGTHVGGIVLQIAPGCEIYSIKVLDKDGRGTWVQVIEGILKAVELGVEIINLSLGSSGECDGSCPVCSSVDYAFSKGLLPVVAAGNEGPEKHSISCPGNSKSALTVGAVDRNLCVAEFSSRGPTADGRIKPDVVAPGVAIYSSYLDNDFRFLSGTSMATPVVSGIMALIFQAEKRGDHDALFSSCIDLHEDPNTQGHGFPNLVLFYERYISKSLAFSRGMRIPPALIGGSAVYLLLKLLGL